MKSTAFPDGRVYDYSARCAAMPKTSSAAKALKRLRERSGLGVREVADRLGKKGSSYAYYEDEYKKPYLPLDLINALAPIFTSKGVDRAELFSLAGIDAVFSTSDPSASNPIAVEVKHLATGIHQIGKTEYAAIGRFDAALSAGPGSLNEDHPEPLGYQLIEQQWLRSVTHAAPEHLSVVRVANDSMERTLVDGDWVLVDHTQTRFEHEGIYALQVGMSTWVKRLTLNLREKLIRIISDNERYPMQELPEEEIRLIGRVVSLVARRL
jgi:hypothetical protein